jgi:hypothetical protein
MVKAFSFVGAGRYETVTYVWEERSHTTRLFPEALARIFEPEKVVVFVTEKAKNSRASESETQVCGNAAGQTRRSGGRNSAHCFTRHWWVANTSSSRVPQKLRALVNLAPVVVLPGACVAVD